MLAQFLKTNASMSVCYAIQDISRCRWLGDNKLDQFYLGWMKLINNVLETDEVSPVFLRGALLGLMENSTKLQLSLHMFKHLPDGDPRK
eukprot:2897163-Alexandrium_andersonii.AAC.1